MLIRDIIDKLAAKNAIGTLDSKQFAIQQQLQAMMNPDGGPGPIEKEFFDAEDIVSDAAKLKKQYKFFLTSGGMPSTFKMETTVEAVYLEITRIGEVKLCLRDEPFKETAPIILQLAPEYIEDIEITGAFLKIKTKYTTVAVQLPDRSVYEFKGKTNGRQA